MHSPDYDSLNQISPTSREVYDRLKLYQSLLLKWQNKINLISNSTIEDSWNRHFLDSAQIAKYISPENSVLDIGSGAGFPGMVLAILGFDKIEMVESDSRKCIFLREVSRETNSISKIHNDRVENLNQQHYDIITSRACANVSQLFSWSEKFVSHGTKCLFPKGKNYLIECDEAKKEWEFDLKPHPSITEKDSVILEFSEIRRRSV